MFTKALLPDTLRAIKLVSSIPKIQEAYLAGGTALVLQLASLADIDAMKIHAIERRGTRRDFVDVCFLSKKYTLEQMLEFYQKKYGVLEDHLYAILRALDYFEDAEKESDMPKMLTEVNWEEVKEYIRRETYRLAQKKLQT